MTGITRTKPALLSETEKARLKAMIAQHQRVRENLSVELQNHLKQLSVQVQKLLFATPLKGDLLASAAQMVRSVIPGLSVPEATYLAEYVLGEIAESMESRSAPASLPPSSQPNIFMSRMHELNRSFSLQYLALQQKIQAENREYTALSNVMKARHDAAKNAINNLR